jgi:catechol 2,3-dioxygenase-like lactoylglutathione lyase family enzyme
VGGVPAVVVDFSHLTLAVRDLARSVNFYVGVVGLTLHAS